MLTETAVSTLLTASLSGAGLILAVYALIIPISRRYFGYRAKTICEDIQELKEKVKDTNTQASKQDLDELGSIIEGLQERHDIPTYLGLGTGLTFLGYMSSTFLGFFWLIDYNRAFAENYIPVVFLFSNIAFLIVGLFSIKDIGQTMKKEYEELKKNVEEKKSTAFIT